MQEPGLSAAEFRFDSLVSTHPANAPASTCASSARRRCGRAAPEMLAQVREQGFVDSRAVCVTPGTAVSWSARWWLLLWPSRRAPTTAARFCDSSEATASVTLGGADAPRFGCRSAVVRPDDAGDRCRILADRQSGRGPRRVVPLLLRSISADAGFRLCRNPWRCSGPRPAAATLRSIATSGSSSFASPSRRGRATDANRAFSRRVSELLADGADVPAEELAGDHGRGRTQGLVAWAGPGQPPRDMT